MVEAVLLVAFFCASCPKAFDPVVGDKYYFPPDCELAKACQPLGAQMPVPERFDGIYPPGWPPGFELPPGTYLYNPRLEEKPTRNDDPMYRYMSVISFKGVAKGQPAELVAYFRNQFKRAGIVLTTDEEHERMEQRTEHTTMVISPRSHSFFAEGINAGDLNMATLNIYFYQDLGGYTYLGGQFVYGEVDMELIPP